MTNPSGPGSGLEVIDTTVMLLIGGAGVWIAIRRPWLVAGAAIGLLAWWESSTRPLAPWLAALAVWAVRRVSLTNGLRYWLLRGGRFR